MISTAILSIKKIYKTKLDISKVFMKPKYLNKKKSLIAFCLILVLSCSEAYEVHEDKLVERQGIKYEINSTVPFTGIEIEVFYDGTLYKAEYKDGKKDGFWEKYYSNGNLDFRYENYYENGDLSEYVGDSESYYENGQLQSKYKDGRYESYYENGQLNKKINKDDSYETYYENGQLESKSGKGTFKEYHPNGQLKSSGNLDKSGLKEGVIKEFDENGNFIATKEYKAGNLVD